jgi:hypothetical protein
MVKLIVPSPASTWPLDLPVCRAIRGLDVDGDPADEIIAATVSSTGFRS